MTTVGAGVREICIHQDGEFRVLYVAKLPEAIYVLSAFEKKTRKTPQKELALAPGTPECPVKAGLDRRSPFSFIAQWLKRPQKGLSPLRLLKKRLMFAPPQAQLFRAVFRAACYNA